jgi:hypothetical protein
MKPDDYCHLASARIVAAANMAAMLLCALFLLPVITRGQVAVKMHR